MRACMHACVRVPDSDSAPVPSHAFVAHFISIICHNNSNTIIYSVRSTVGETFRQKSMLKMGAAQYMFCTTQHSDNCTGSND